MALPARAHGWSVPLAHSPRDSASHMKGLRYQAWSAPDACGAAVQLSSGNMGCYTNTKAAACLWLAPHLASDGATGQGSSGGQSPVNMAGAENTWQEDQDMPNATSCLVVGNQMVQAEAHSPPAGRL